MKQTQLTPDSSKKRRIVLQTQTGRQEERAISTVPQTKSQPVSSSEGQLAEVDVIGTESMTEDDSLAPPNSQQHFKIPKTTTKLKSVDSRLSNLVPATPYNMAEIEQHQSTWRKTLARYKNELSGKISRINHLEEKVDRQEMELQSIRETRKKTDEQGKRTSEYLAMTKRALYDAEQQITWLKKELEEEKRRSCAAEAIVSMYNSVNCSATTRIGVDAATMTASDAPEQAIERELHKEDQPSDTALLLPPQADLKTKSVPSMPRPTLSSQFGGSCSHACPSTSVTDDYPTYVTRTNTE
jgi:hypothetical protein